MNYLSEKITEAAAKVGGIQALENQLDLPKKTLSMVGKTRGLPLEACYKLADITGADLARIIAASQAITAKNSKADFWKKKLVEFEKLAACVLVGVILNMTPTPSEAAETHAKSLITLYIMSN